MFHSISLTSLVIEESEEISSGETNRDYEYNQNYTSCRDGYTSASIGSYAWTGNDEKVI